MPHTGEFSHCSIVKSDEAPLAELAEVGGEDIVLNGEFGPLGRRAVDIGPFGEGAGPLHQPIRSDLEEVLAISLSSGFKTPATQAGAVFRHSPSSLLDGGGEFWFAGVAAGERSGLRRQSFCLKPVNSQLLGREDSLELQFGLSGVGSLDERR